MTSSLRQRLARPEIVIAPGVYDGVTARLVGEAGFEVAYLSGAGVSYSLLGQPDVGLVSLKEMADRVAAVAAALPVPLIADGDNGHGGILNVARTVELFEAGGAAAIQLEDQAFPKRCGHLAGKRLIGTGEMVGKIRAACAARRSDDFLIIGRTDARGVEGLDAAVARARAYREAGADLLFVEAPRSEAELIAVADQLRGVPLVANMVEGGATPSVPAARLEQLGYALVLFPNALTRAFAHSGRRLLAELAATGTTASMSDQMVDFAGLNQLLGLDALMARESELPA
jgi:2-methylisocitrate lyase-like PEP mutase family enzyme